MIPLGLRKNWLSQFQNGLIASGSFMFVLKCPMVGNAWKCEKPLLVIALSKTLINVLNQEWAVFYWDLTPPLTCNAKVHSIYSVLILQCVFWCFLFVTLPVCGRFSLWPFWSMAVPVCGCSGLWPFRFVSLCGPFGQWPFRFVAAMTCYRNSSSKWTHATWLP